MLLSAAVGGGAPASSLRLEIIRLPSWKKSAELRLAATIASHPLSFPLPSVFPVSPFPHSRAGARNAAAYFPNLARGPGIPARDGVIDGGSVLERLGCSACRASESRSVSAAEGGRFHWNRWLPSPLPLPSLLSSLFSAVPSPAEGPRSVARFQLDGDVASLCQKPLRNLARGPGSVRVVACQKFCGPMCLESTRLKKNGLEIFL